MMAPAASNWVNVFRWPLCRGVSRNISTRRRRSLRVTSAARLSSDEVTPQAISDADFTEQGATSIPKVRKEPLAIEVKGRARTGAIEMKENEWAKACTLGERYWLYVAFDCATPHPRLVRVKNPFKKLLAKGQGGVVINAGEIYEAGES